MGLLEKNFIHNKTMEILKTYSEKKVNFFM